jgi:uncharacterized protein DUF6934
MINLSTLVFSGALYKDLIMHLERYEYESNEEFREHGFYSEGPAGKIRKRVRLDPMVENNIPFFNLYFGDWNSQKGRIDDISVSNNKDTDKILATVAVIVQQFIERLPRSIIFAQGSTQARTRLYQMLLNRYRNKIAENLEILGFNEKNKWTSFESGINYDAFILKTK